MKEIKLTRGMTTLVDDEDYEYLNRFKWYAAKTLHAWYATRCVRKQGGYIRYHMHRVIMSTTDGLVVDHKDHNGLNNQKSNLRNCTVSQNAFNSFAKGEIKYKGVSRVSLTQKKIFSDGVVREYKNTIVFKSFIRIDKKPKYLGKYKTPEDAAEAYNKAAQKYHGEFAIINIINHA